MIAFRIRRRIKRPSKSLVSRFQTYYLPDVSDKVGRMYTMNTSIRSLYSPAVRVVGPAVTVKVPPGDNMGVKEALRHITDGDVLVIDAQGFMEWCLGGFHMLLLSIRQRGLKGLIVNGAYRDVSEAEEARFPIYAKGVAPWSGPKRGPAEVNVPVCCGGVIVHPGDIVMADADGVVAVPLSYAEAIADSLDRGPRNPRSEDMTDAELIADENTRAEYFEAVFKRTGGIYLD